MTTAAVELLAGSAHETLRIAAALGRSLAGGDVLALVGELGAGKTTFTRGVCRGLGVTDERLISSPTYVLEHVYPGPVPVRHYDAYRLASAGELVALGFLEQLDTAQVLIVEWADKVQGALPPGRLTVELLHAPGPGGATGRRLILSGPSPQWRARLEDFRLRASAGT